MMFTKYLEKVDTYGQAFDEFIYPDLSHNY